MGGLLAWEFWLQGQRGARRREEAGSSEQALSRMSEQCLAEGLGGVLGMSAPVGTSKESGESPGSMWPKDLILLEPGETAWQVVLKKIRELSDGVGGMCREGQRGRG